MSSLADLKSVLVRMTEVETQVEERRSELSQEQLTSLDILKENTDAMREELHELLVSKPDVPEEYFPPISPESQTMIDNAVLIIGGTANMLESWLNSS